MATFRVSNLFNRQLSSIINNKSIPLFPKILRVDSLLPYSAIFTNVWRETITINTGILGQLFGPFLWAVPKQRTSHSKKRIRSMANSSLKDISNIGACQACGRHKLTHHFCSFCYADFRRRAKKERQMAQSEDE
ncbi:270_t:CDS:1 [Ambispora gerdemannii]|uniref:Large ribosomal subunit protein bL32m n=1 Tax=Ambispora gerdemannii TaxID=144530 RepID=A0A9N8VDQ7_9GLOM|nr:270_t:CDS:1 [Ambispora gerdemannii]